MLPASDAGRLLNTLTKLVSDLSRLGESNPGLTHYEGTAQPHPRQSRDPKAHLAPLTALPRERRPSYQHIQQRVKIKHPCQPGSLAPIFAPGSRPLAGLDSALLGAPQV